MALEPTPEQVAAHAAQLAIAYNDPRNATLLGHTHPLSAEDVIGHYTELAEDGGHPFLLFRDGQLSGDGDLRGLHDGAAEFAFLIADPGAQGKGLGTRFATMLCAAGFARLGLARIYASIVPANTASRRVFEKLGFALDESQLARDFADEPGDVVMSIDRKVFERVNAAAIADIVL
jgi:RimJ/RimL family protein N-acetyltransferase